MDVITLAFHSALVMQTAALAPKEEKLGMPEPPPPCLVRCLVLPAPHPQIGPRLLANPAVHRGGKK